MEEVGLSLVRKNWLGTRSVDGLGSSVVKLSNSGLKPWFLFPTMNQNMCCVLLKDSQL